MFPFFNRSVCSTTKKTIIVNVASLLYLCLFVSFIILGCGDPAPTNGASNISSGTLYGDFATVHCNPGYDLYGSITIVCTETGEWNETVECAIQGWMSLLNDKKEPKAFYL